jgi:lambda repressor-like predicted transcriptional regulator
MSISTISSTSYAARAQQALATQRTQDRQNGGALGVAAETLGLSTSDLTSQLQQGKSLVDIAEAQGVSRDDLADALKAALPAQRPTPPPPPPLAPASAPDSATGLLSGNLTDDQQDALDSLSAALDTDSQSVLEQLQSGTSLNDLFQGAGLNATTFATLMQDGLLFDTRA